MKQIRVTFDNGDSITTRINGTPAEIERYYIGQVFNVGIGPEDNMTRAVSVEFLETA